jgi:hypothetical protein
LTRRFLRWRTEFRPAPTTRRNRDQVNALVGRAPEVGSDAAVPRTFVVPYVACGVADVVVDGEASVGGVVETVVVDDDVDVEGAGARDTQPAGPIATRPGRLTDATVSTEYVERSTRASEFPAAFATYR